MTNQRGTRKSRTTPTSPPVSVSMQKRPPSGRGAERGRLSSSRKGTTAVAAVSRLAALGLGVALLFLIFSARLGGTATVGQGQAGALPAGSSGVASGNIEAPAPKLGRMAPDFTLQTLDGQQVSLSQLRGKPIWINFWATWCPPCQAEMPEMQRKYEVFKDKGLVIVGVNFGERATTVRDFITGSGFGWTFGLDEENTIANKYGVGGLPAHFFVGTAGDIKAVQLGGLTGDMMDHDLASILK